jgi:hypothetical protein
MSVMRNATVPVGRFLMGYHDTGARFDERLVALAPQKHKKHKILGQAGTRIAEDDPH